MADPGTSTIVDFYTHRYREDERLHGRPQAHLERLRTLELLHELLPDPPAPVLDVGGGTGVYARALAGAGYRVRLLDLVPAHAAEARTGSPPIGAAVADARRLPVPDGAFAATLLLGPLYHLHRRADRVAALAEAARVTRPGGPIIAAAISRFAGPLDFAATGRWDARWIDEARRLLTEGANKPEFGFTHAWFHRVPDLIDECRDAGLRRVVVHGVEGPAWIAAEAAAGTPAAGTVFAAALHLARIYDSESAVVATSAHLLATGTAPGPGPGPTAPAPAR